MDKLKTARFTVGGEIQAKQRHRMTKTGIAYTPKETVEYENWVKLCYKEQCKDIFFTRPMAATVKVFLQMPKSMPKYQLEQVKNDERFPTKRPDLDNMIKSIFDALNEIAYKDDSSIVQVIVFKRWSDKPRVEVEITEIDANRDFKGKAEEC